MAGEEQGADGPARRRTAQQRLSTVAAPAHEDDTYFRRASMSMALPADLGKKRLEWDRQQVIRILKERGNGSFFRGWRQELDLDGAFQVNFQDFCRAAARLGFAVDARGLFSIDDDDKYLNLEELAPVYGGLMNSFLEWVRNRFGGPAKLMPCLDKAGCGRLSVETFTKGCKMYGFQGSEEDLAELFCFCDVHDEHWIRMEDLLIFEANQHTRQLEAFKRRTKMSDKDFRQRLLAEMYSEEKRSTLPKRHRLAPRPWMAQQFEALPTVVCQRRGEQRQFVLRRAMHARTIFLRHLREKFGNDVRGFRCGLDPEETFGVSQTDIRAYCRKVNLNVDMGALWKSLDKDSDQMLDFHELCPKAGNVLAQFQNWAFDKRGSCAAIWNAPETRAARCRPARNGSWASDKKLLFSTFAEALKALGWKPVEDREIRNILFISLDKYGCGFISYEDLQWVDKFFPPEWLGAQPDEEAWDDFREQMLEKYIHPLQAWRMLLDRDDSNSVSWEEFRSACDSLKWEGNIVGAWRFLDMDISGTISLKEFDMESYELLTSFKDWCDTNWGSVLLTFKALDADGSNALSIGELKRACNKYNWHGDVRLIFDCLDVDQKRDATCVGIESSGKRSISAEELRFLDSWPQEPTDEEIKEDEALLETTWLYKSPNAVFQAKPEASEGQTASTTLTSSTTSISSATSRPSTHSATLRPATSTSSRPTTNSATSRPTTGLHPIPALRLGIHGKPGTSDRRTRRANACRSAPLSKPLRRPPSVAGHIPFPSLDRAVGSEYLGPGYARGVRDDTEHVARMQEIETFLEKEERLLAKSASAPSMAFAGGRQPLPKLRSGQVPYSGIPSRQLSRAFASPVASPIALVH
mmetsp:Transcript_3722/g.6600  ORF Transcript_3722/g.6600 Transcript_3722/m.6600 type:complete len:865 (-) Transcript_3722:83-2677(-)